jgi:hypothetical protein
MRQSSGGGRMSAALGVARHGAQQTYGPTRAAGASQPLGARSHSRRRANGA